MDETRYEVFVEHRRIRVLFDLRNDESCFLGLSFFEEDALAIINMGHLGQKLISVDGINGTASLSGERSLGRNICLAYENGGSGIGTVFYPYAKLTRLLEQALSELSESSVP
ncbi:hypothetical protein [Nitrogeniibacter aestuarii]|uniref:hypothetical protein n=1 Tax=Nitrogeniibacter aestuarii TaxID=2815343 RepID=UPI001D127E52|nr:hypothetical protein [Nitrogeniibacter aestuarii]